MLTIAYEGIALTSQRIDCGDTALAVGSSIYKYEEKKLHIDHGGTAEITAGMRILGNTSAAVAIVTYVGAVEGATTWAGADAACYLWLKSVVGTFQNNETLRIDGTADAATVDGTLISLTKDQYIYPEYYGLTARQLWVQAETNALRIAFDGSYPTQTSKMGMVLENGSTFVLCDAEDMRRLYIIDAVSGTSGYANVVGRF